ncbi:hypothetical protein [Peribacillus simplex]|uniref:hypothetical protein n=1 Tax=Peribacillus simplex TaxID=1478 RepID=UPI003D9BEB4A
MFHAGIVYMLYNLLIQREGALFASFSNYIVPVIGIILGYVVFKNHYFHNIRLVCLSFFLLFYFRMRTFLENGLGRIFCTWNSKYKQLMIM